MEKLGDIANVSIRLEVEVSQTKSQRLQESKFELLHDMMHSLFSFPRNHFSDFVQFSDFSALSFNMVWNFYVIPVHN